MFIITAFGFFFKKTMKLMAKVFLVPPEEQTPRPSGWEGIGMGYPDEDNEAVHVIPVPIGWSVEQAWECIARDDFPQDLEEDDVSWASVLGKGPKLLKIYGEGRHWEEHGPLPPLTDPEDPR